MSRTSSTFDVTCPQCKLPVSANETQVGMRITCSNCLEEFVVARPPNSVKAKVSPSTSRPTENLAKSTSARPRRDAALDDDLLGLDDDGGSAPASREDPGNWDDDRRQLDALLNVDGSGSSGSPSSGGPYDFTVVCLLCGTRLEAKSEQIGQKMQCPDCHSTFDVREPSRKSRRPRVPVISESEELRLSELDPELPAKTDFRSMPDQVLRRAQPTSPTVGPSQPPRITTPNDASRDTLARAQKELDEQLKGQRSLPKSPMTADVFRFLQHPTILLRVFFIAMAWWLELGAIQAALDLTSGGALQQFASVILRPFAVVFGVLLAANFASLLINIAQDTSHGRDEMESLPSVNPVEWLSESWQVFLSLFLTMALAGVVAQGVYMSTGSWTSAFMFGLVPAGFLLATVFPVVLLSFLDNNTPYSPAVVKGLQVAAGSWMVFTMQALALAAVGIGLCALRWNSSSGVINFGISIGLVLIAMLFFRLLGRLTWVCQEKLAAEVAE